MTVNKFISMHKDIPMSLCVCMCVYINICLCAILCINQDILRI